MAKRDTEDELEGKRAVDFGPEERDGYRRTRRQVARGEDKPNSDAGKGKDKEEDLPKTAYQRFMDEHWDAWLGPVLMLVIVAALALGYKFELVRESMLGMLLSAGLVGLAIYSTVVPAYDLIERKAGRYAFVALSILWVAAAGYPTLRKATTRAVYAQTVLSSEHKTDTLKLPDGKTGPFDLTVSGTLKPEISMNGSAVFDLQVAMDGATESVNGEFATKTNQMRVRRGTAMWTEQTNQVEHRLPRSFRGHSLTVSVEQIDDAIDGGLHVTVHPQSYDPKWFFLLGVLVVLGMIYVETQIGDSKTKTHLTMASASTMVFAFHFHEHASAARMVRPAFDSLILAALVGGIGGTLIGAVARRASGRDKIQAKDDDKTGEKADAE
ncbi:MAG TPA: hypothetical protein PKE31_00710 [Pseudomonadota bacterium]|nr:hypothetical protein [Pseudomonadota bacterium]